MFANFWSSAIFSPAIPPWLNTDKPYWNEFLPVAIVLFVMVIATILVISYRDPTRKAFILFRERITKLEIEIMNLYSELELITKTKGEEGAENK